LLCMLLVQKTGGGGKSSFTHCGWRNWNRDNALDRHVGGVDSAHNAAREVQLLFDS
jgi:hypothetical protein